MQVRFSVKHIGGRPRIADCLSFSIPTQHNQWGQWLRIAAALLLAFGFIASGRGCKTQTNRAEVSAR